MDLIPTTLKRMLPESVYWLVSYSASQLTNFTTFDHKTPCALGNDRFPPLRGGQKVSGSCAEV